MSGILLMSKKGPSYPDLLSATEWQAVGKAYGLTRRELETLRLVSSGICNNAMATHLRVSKATVRSHLRAVYAKMGCEDRVDVILRLTHRRNSHNSRNHQPG